MGAEDLVGRPSRKSDYQIYFASARLEKRWRDLLATRRNDLVDAWDFLTATPQLKTPLSDEMVGDLSIVSHNEQNHQRFQLKLSATNGARIWYFVVDNKVFIEQIFTQHPNKTKR